MLFKPKNIFWHEGQVERADRRTLLDQAGATIWLTGLPSSGKSTLAFTLEHALFRRGWTAYVLDGDNLRHGLNRDLGFSQADRTENIRRVGELSCLFADAGLICIASFISPLLRDRDLVRARHYEAKLPFLEVFVDTPLTVCEDRDPKGLYKRARSGEIEGFTGIDSPYEKPAIPDLVYRSDQLTPQEGAAMIMSRLQDLGILVL